MSVLKLKITDIFAMLAGLLITSDIVWSMGASGVFKSTLGPYYILMQAQTVLFMGILIAFITLGFRAKTEFIFFCGIFISVGFYECVVACFMGTGQYGLQEFFFGFLFPVTLMITLIRMGNQTLFFRYYYIGYILYLMVALFLLLCLDDNIYSLIRAYGWGGAIIALKYNTEGSLFFLILGNANKQSNYLLLSILLGPYLLQLQSGNNRLYRNFVALATIVLFLLCSRAALLLLPLVLYLNRIYFLPEIKKYRYFLLMGFGLGALVFLNQIIVMFKYILFTHYIDGASDGFGGSFHTRFQQWGSLITLLLDPRVLFHGLGVGNYGLMQGGLPERGSHNLFFDHWLASGVYGPLILIFIIGFGITKAMLSADKRLLMIYFTFVCLAMREYSFSYLYVTSMGGLLFVFILYLTFNCQNTLTLNPKPLIAKKERL